MGKVRRMPSAATTGGVAVGISINVKKFFEFYAFYQAWKAAKAREAGREPSPPHEIATPTRPALSAYVEDAPPETDR